MGPYILSSLNKEAAKMFRTTGVRPTAPATVIWETLRQLFEKLELPAVYRERFFSRRQETGGISRQFSERPSGAGAKGPRTVAPCRV
ncbi:hypothetical protein AHF37_08115 [Paragonimus kellicotti]|nr:hypothetical protein AHF37_08115 [Paragonimus kellicotti]